MMKTGRESALVSDTTTRLCLLRIPVFFYYDTAENDMNSISECVKGHLLGFPHFKGRHTQTFSPPYHKKKKKKKKK